MTQPGQLPSLMPLLAELSASMRMDTHVVVGHKATIVLNGQAMPQAGSGRTEAAARLRATAAFFRAYARSLEEAASKEG